MPRWSRQKGGREGRAHAPGHGRQPLSPRSRGGRAPARDPAWARKRERAALPAATARRLAEAGIQSRISQPRRAGDPIPDGQRGREVWRGKKRRVKTRDPQARHRWPVERTNAWLKALRRIATRRDRKADNYLAFLHLGIIVILTRSF